MFWHFVLSLCNAVWNNFMRPLNNLKHLRFCLFLTFYKELLRQKAESEAKKKKIESLKSRLDAAKTEAEKNSILHEYSLNLRADAGFVV